MGKGKIGWQIRASVSNDTMPRNRFLGMSVPGKLWFLRWALACGVLAMAPARAQRAAPVEIRVDWKRAAQVNRTTITLQVVANPRLRRGSTAQASAWKSLRDLNASYARLALWYPYPRMGVAELSEPAAAETSWDFSAMDPLIEDFFSAVGTRPAVLCVCTVPQWMFAGTNAPAVPEDPDAAVWNYEQGTALRDDSLREVADYYERVARWYMKGGFNDERGVRHWSGHHYRPAFWEVFNEPEYEHNFSAEQYTRLYDAIVSRLRRVDRHLKFTGASLAIPDKGEAFFEYFLDRRHHSAGNPVDAISYHFYALGKKDQPVETQASEFFAQADHFLETVHKIDAIRQRLSPTTQTQINETGCIAAGDQGEGPEKMSGGNIPASYWQLCAATFAYVAGNLARAGIEVVGASQLMGHPGQFPSVSLLDWTTGLPNPRYHALKLLIDNLAPGDRLVDRDVQTPDLYALPLLSRAGERKILLVNKTSRDVQVLFGSDAVRRESHVDMSATGTQLRDNLSTKAVVLRPFAVMVAHVRPTSP